MADKKPQAKPGGLGKGLAALIPTGPGAPTRKPRLGDSAADVILVLHSPVKSKARLMPVMLIRSLLNPRADWAVVARLPAVINASPEHLRSPRRILKSVSPSPHPSERPIARSQLVRSSRTQSSRAPSLMRKSSMSWCTQFANLDCCSQLLFVHPGRVVLN